MLLVVLATRLTRRPWQHQLTTAYMEYCLLGLLGPGSTPVACISWLAADCDSHRPPSARPGPTSKARFGLPTSEARFFPTS
eukprot:4410598-Pleurochrysis_carterae.AAC.2